MSEFKKLENVRIANYAILYERFYAHENLVVFPPHWHKRTEILHVVSGCLEITFDKEVILLKANDFCYIRSALPHAGISRSDDLEYEMVQFRESDHQQILDTNKELLPFAENDIEINQTFQDDYIDELFHHISEHYHIKSAYQNTLFLGIMYEIYAHLALRHSTVKKTEIYAADNFSKAVRHINKYYADISSIAELAKMFSFEPSYFSRAFKKKMGVSATHYICSLKLEDSEKYLVTTDLSTEIISQKCGFNSASYFTKCFKQHYGISPMQYRKLSQTQTESLQPKTETA